MQEQALYFIALIPPEPIFSEAQAYKKLFAEEFRSKAALKSPPHITLHMPFKLKLKQEEQLKEVLSDNTSEVKPFEMHLDGFGQFNQRVIYIHVDGGEPLHNLFKALMKAMKINFNIFNADYKNRGYNPHLTLAFRDLKKDAFKVAWPQFEDKPYNHNFLADNFTLLKHNGSRWEVFEQFALGN